MDHLHIVLMDHLLRTTEEYETLKNQTQVIFIKLN